MDREAMISFLNNFCDSNYSCEGCTLDKKYEECISEDWCDMSDVELAERVEIATEHKHFENMEEAACDTAHPTDNVNHPQHYELPGGLECFDVIVATQGVEAAKHFCLCNAMKYLFRSQRKNGAEDIEKARWYLNKHHDLVEGEGDLNDD